MHFKSLRHVRDHVKVQGRPYELLTHIALHTNMHTGEAFELSIERQAHRHQITPEWTRRLLNGLIATGELVVERSRGRHPNRYRFPLERCHACQGDDINPEVPLGDDIIPELNPKLPVQSKYPCDCVVAVLPQFSKPLTTRRLAPHIQIVERIIEWKPRAFETANGLCNLCIRHIAPRIILSVEHKDTSMGASFLLPRLVQPQEIADIGCDHSTLLDRGIAEMGCILGATHGHRPGGHHHVSLLLQEADQHICIQVIIEIESHRRAEESSAKNPCASSHARSASFSAQITSHWSWQYAKASKTANTGRSRFWAICCGVMREI